jgi:hypothetical protein
MEAGKSVVKPNYVYSVNSHGAHLMNTDRAQLAINQAKLFFVHSRAKSVIFIKKKWVQRSA